MFRPLLACLALLLLLACGGGGGTTGSGGGTPAAATLSALSLSPAAPSLLVGATRQFTATGTYSDGSAKDLSASVSWVSASPAAATITAAGLATGLASGPQSVLRRVPNTARGFKSSAAAIFGAIVRIPWRVGWGRDP